MTVMARHLIVMLYVSNVCAVAEADNHRGPMACHALARRDNAERRRASWRARGIAVCAVRVTNDIMRSFEAAREISYC